MKFEQKNFNLLKTIGKELSFSLQYFLLSNSPEVWGDTKGEIAEQMELLAYEDIPAYIPPWLGRMRPPVWEPESPRTLL